MASKVLRIGFLGGGKIAQSMAKGFLSAGLAKGETMTSSFHPTDLASAKAFKDLGSETFFENIPVVEKSDIVIISVKPSIVPIVLSDIRNLQKLTDKLFISIAMGLTIKKLQELIPGDSRVVRVMPNLPGLVNSAASVFTCGRHCTESDAAITQKLFDSIGTCEQVPETLFDIATGVSGAGPAYILAVIEGLADGAVKMGMPRDMAYRLASQTVYGTGRLVRDTKMHPGILKDDVTSPGGATAAGSYYLESKGIRAAFNGAVEAATKRSMEVRLEQSEK